MSNTRKSKTGEFNQERYSSSPEYGRGLVANLVAQRCSILSDPRDKALILWLQWESHQVGGLGAFVSRFVDHAGGKIGTNLMLKMGLHDQGRVFTAEEVKVLRAEVERRERYEMEDCDYLESDRSIVPDNYYNGAFPLRGDTRKYLVVPWEGPSREVGEDGDYPDSYPASAFLDYSISRIKAVLEERLTDFCLNPESTFPNHRLFPELRNALESFKEEDSKAGTSFVLTAIARQVFAGLRMARRGRVTLIDGLERTGKTVAAKEWCTRNAGLARYVPVPATNDDIGFYRAIAKALGVSSALSMKGVQMRERVEFVVQATGIMLVLDNAEYLWPQNNRREALPNRLNWILNALVEHGAPVALISSPQFKQDEKIVERKTLWRSERFRSVLTQRIKLPKVIGDEDLRMLVARYVPEATEKGVALICEYVATSAKYISGIEAVVTRARFLAEEADRQSVTTADIVTAIEEDSMPSDDAVERGVRHDSKRRAKAVQMRSEGPCRSDFVEATDRARNDLETLEMA